MTGPDELAIAQHGYLVSDLEDLIQAVRDMDDGAPPLFEREKRPFSPGNAVESTLSFAELRMISAFVRYTPRKGPI